MGMHVLDMIKRLKENERLIKKSQFKTKNTYVLKLDIVNLDYKTATREELAVIRRSVKEERTREKLKSIVSFIISILVALILAFLFWKFVKL